MTVAKVLWMKSLALFCHPLPLDQNWLDGFTASVK